MSITTATAQQVAVLDTPSTSVLDTPSTSSRWLALTCHPLTGLAIALASTLAFLGLGLFNGVSTVSLVGLLLVAWLAAENGGNDVSKAIAPLVASGSTSELGALAYGTAVTAMGSVASIYLASNVLKLFTSGFIAPGYDVTGGMMLAIAAGATLWVALATRFALPVSTTHAIIGAILMVSSLAYGINGVVWSKLGAKVVAPLLLSPVLGGIAAWMIVMVLQCVRIPHVVNRSMTWLSSGAISFVRAVNDTPKIVAVAYFALTLSTPISAQHKIGLFFLITVAMAMGSLIKGLAVTRLLAYKVTHVDDAGSLASTVSTAVLVLAASNCGLPVSTTHVSSSAIIGTGLRKRFKGHVCEECGTAVCLCTNACAKPGSAVNWAVVRHMVLSWVITLPAAGAIGAIVYFLSLSSH